MIGQLSAVRDSDWLMTHLDDQGSDGDEGQDQHVEDEELLTRMSCGVDLVASNSPSSVLQTLKQLFN